MASALERLLPAIGDVLGSRYILRREISRGAFGIVLEATQTGLEELVTIKILMPHVLTNEDMVRRFEREVLLAKGLRHPNTIRILDLGQTSAGLPYYVMEHVPGSNLREVLKHEGCLSPAATQRIGIQVLRSLAEAHARGIVHRDLKPSNLLRCDIPGARDFIKVLDFGVAKAMAAKTDEQTTHTGVVIGTPAYMSPEQARGAREVDARSDLYSVGLILAECLTGQRALDVTTLYDAITFHAEAEAARLPESLALSPLYPIIARATRADPAERFRSADQMGRAIESLVGLSELPDWRLVPEGTRERQDTPPTLPATPAPVSAVSILGTPRPTFSSRPSVERAARRLSARRWLPSGVAAALFLAALLLFGLTWRRHVPPPESATAIVPEMPQSSRTDPREATPDGASARMVKPAPTTVARPGTTPGPARGPEALAASLSEARSRLSAALPPPARISIDGTRGAQVRIGERGLGRIPFEVTHPRLDTEIVVEASRRGYTTLRRSLRLDTDHWSIELERRADELERTGPSELPFGRMPLYTTGDSD